MNDPERIDPLALINKFAQKEKELATTTFLAPVTAGGKVRVSFDGVIYEMIVDDRRFEGWGVFKMSGPGHASLVEPASMSLVSNYLKLLPRKRFVLIDKFDGQWFALPASNSDTRFALDQPVPLRLLTLATAAPMDTVNARFDGSSFYFDGIERRRDPIVGRTLRQQLEKKIDPDQVRSAGMTPQERLVYRILYLQRYKEEIPIDDRKRISDALRHADATLEAFWYDENRPEAATVRFMVDGEMHTAVVNTSDFTVVSAGICLSGKDNDFDLSSLVGVFRDYRLNWD
jgi:hypothetical protein